MSRPEQIEAVHELAENFDAEVFADYSGRGMYGATCYGIVARPDQLSAVEKAAEELGLRRPNADSLGLNVIIY